ncbi:MAG: nitroreductase family protein [Chloroflexi bacterium]|nr:nitroreductase family protein [Chloroflexota bacterium]
MMNETLKIIENRRSVRKFSSKILTTDEKNVILHAALRAPTAGNMMLYSIIEVEDQTLKDRLAVTCDDQPFIATAPWVLLFVADYQRFFDFYAFCNVESVCKEKGINARLPGDGDLLLASCDALIAAQTAVISAESLGIGSCYIGDILENAEIHRELFDLPRYSLPIALLVFGRPTAEKAENRLTPRYAQEYIVFRNKYHRLTPKEFVKMNEPAASHKFPQLPLQEAAVELGRNNYFRKFMSGFAIELDRSSRAWINTWNNDQ